MREYHWKQVGFKVIIENGVVRIEVLADNEDHDETWPAHIVQELEKNLYAA